MAGPADGPARSLRDFAERTLFAGVGVVVLTRDRVEELADELARRGAVTRDEAVKVVEDLALRWRDEPGRFAERASFNFSSVFRDLGLVTRREYEELDLRLAQVEHRLRLLEHGPAPVRATRAPAPGEPLTAPPATGEPPAAELAPLPREPTGAAGDSPDEAPTRVEPAPPGP